MSLAEKILSEMSPVSHMKFGLDRIRAALAEAGDPQKRLRVFTVGGTNGKGSTCVLISSVLRAHGFEVATFLSPHLYKVEERFQWNLEPIETEALDELA